MKLGILGLPGSGKTALLGALMHDLARGGGADSPYAYHGLEGRESFGDLFAYAGVLEKGEFPPRTGRDRIARYTIALRERTTGTVREVELPEMSGEHVDAVWHADRIPAEVAFLKDSQGLLLLVDAVGTAPESTVARHVHLLQTIERARGTARPRRSAVPVGLVFTKWDALPGEERALGPEALARRLVPLLLDFVQSNHVSSRCFGLSAVGATDASGKPLVRDGRLEPLALLDPFVWALGLTPGA
jgi:hypothetical protein